MKNKPDLFKLKSGSDIRGTAISETGNPELGPVEVRAIARGFARAFGLKKVAIGHDSRLTADLLSGAAAEGLMAENANVLFCGLCSTPSVYMMTKLAGADGAIMITASHHPKNKNGLKFFTKGGGVDKRELEAIITAADKILADDFDSEFLDKTFDLSLTGGEHKDAVLLKKNDAKATVAVYEERDFLGLYCDYLKDIFIRELGDMPLKGFKIAVDAGSGASGFYAERILKPLGADISGSQYLEPDGNFPFHEPNPENKAAMESISKRVTNTKSDMGVIFDTDGDRCAVVDADGTEISRNRLIALVSDIVLRESPKAYIVTDSVTSDGLKTFIEGLGGTHVRYKRGYQNVISYAKSLCEKGKNAPLAIETSGHAALKENFFLDDGAYLAAKLIITAVRLRREGKRLGDIISTLKEPVEEAAVRIKLIGDDWQKTGAKIIEAIEGLKDKFKLAEDSFEGVRLSCDYGWFMARMSVHDPVVAINIESDIVSGCCKLAGVIFEAIKDINSANFEEITAVL